MSLTPEEVARTADWIASVQLPTGMIPWYPGGHADPWNHVEAAMALVVGGRRAEADAAYRWLADTQLADGSWCLYYLAEGVEEPRRDPNVCAYVATGVWWHWLETGDDAFLERMWPVVDRAIAFVVRLQRPDGAFAWSLDVDGAVGGFALLTGSSSIHHSLRSAVAVADLMGEERPEWELAADRLREAVVVADPGVFVSKDRWAMDWYYPVLGRALTGPEAVARIEGRWANFFVEDVGIRCVSDHEWITVAETSECAIALAGAGLIERAGRLMSLTAHFRQPGGQYWTGCVHPACVRYPGGEHSTYSAAAVVLANHVIEGRGRGRAVFDGAGDFQALEGLAQSLVSREP